MVWLSCAYGSATAHPTDPLKCRIIPAGYSSTGPAGALTEHALSPHPKFVPSASGFRALRRPEAVETSGIIDPIGIAKIGQTVDAGDGVGRHGDPDGIGQVGRGFHHESPGVANDTGPQLVYL